MRISDGMLVRGISLKTVLLLAILLIPFILPGLTVSQPVSMNDTSLKEHTTSSVLVTGNFQYFDVAPNIETDKIIIVAYHSDSIPEANSRSFSNYYRWEYENGNWRDTSGHDSEYIESSKCSKDNGTYSFYIGIDIKAKPGHWTILILIDDEEVVYSTSSIKVVAQFNFFLLSLIGVYEPCIRDKKTISDIDFICSERKRIMIESKRNIDDIVDNVLNKPPLKNQKEKQEEIIDLCIFKNVQPSEEESIKTTVSTYSKSRLKTNSSDATSSFFINKKVGGGDRFWSNKKVGYGRFFAIILAIFLISAAFIPIIAPQDTKCTSCPTISSFNIFPDKVNLGDFLIINVSTTNPVGITSVFADIDGLVTINLSLKEGNIVNGTIYSGYWQGNWTVSNVHPGNYTLMVTAMNEENMSISKELIFTVLPTFNMNVSNNNIFGYPLEESFNTTQIGNQTDDITNTSINSVQDEMINCTFSGENETEQLIENDTILEENTTYVNGNLEHIDSNLKTIYTETNNCIEVKEKRTIYSKTFLDQDGSYQERIGVGPIHYPDEDGNLEDIDTRFVVSDDLEYDYEVTKGFYETKFKKDADSANLAEYRLNDFVTQIQLLDLSWTDEYGEKELISQPQVIDGVVKENKIIINKEIFLF